MNIKDIEIGMAVIYVNNNEEGIVTSKNGLYAFVRYGNSYTSQATRPEDLKPV